jgi:hypothetical protein
VTSTLSLADRITVTAVRWLLHRLERRLDQQQGRVWWFNVVTARPNRAMWPDGPVGDWPDDVQAGAIRVGFGGDKSALEPPMFAIGLTRPMLDLLVDGAVEVRGRQDIQVAALKAVTGT